MRGLLLARSFLIQGSWNYRNLIGTGLAWSVLPVTGSSDTAEAPPDSPEEAFNSHPYLSTVAIGALARLVREGADPERVRRFLQALRSPLGSLGDKLFWGTWRPLCVLTAILAFVLGTPPTWVAFGFLVGYNALHLALRVWGLQIGIRAGFGVARVMARARLAERSERMEVLGVLVSGTLLGGLSHMALGLPGRPWFWLLGGAGLLLTGFSGSRALGRWMPGLLLAFVVLGLAMGASPAALIME